MKIQSLSLFISFIYLFLIALTTSVSVAYTNSNQDIIINKTVEVSQGSTLIIEQLLKLTTPANITLVSSSTCRFEHARFSFNEQIPFTGTIPVHEKIFMIENHIYGMMIESMSRQIMLREYTTNMSEDGIHGVVVHKERHIFTEIASGEDPFIIGLKVYKDFAIFTTHYELLIFNVLDIAVPKLIIVPLEKPPLLFTRAGDQVLIIHEGYSISDFLVVNLTIGTQAELLIEIPNYDLQSNAKTRALCICDDVMFTTQEKSVFADKANVLGWKQVDFDDEIIDMLKIGRSLIVLTAKELVEYVFINHCLDFQVNTRFPNTQFGVEPALSLQDKFAQLSLHESSQGKYFALLNKGTNTIYMFQNGGIQQSLQNNSLPYVYTYQHSDNIDSVDLFDYFVNFQTNGVNIVLRSNNKASIISFKTEGTRLTCASNDVATIHAEARFCNNDVYDYTDFIKNRVEQEEEETYTSDVYYDPTLPCKRILNLTVEPLKNPLITGMFIAIVVGGALLLVAIIYLRQRLQKKNKKKAIKYRGLKRIQDENEESNASQNLDISSLSLPAGTDRKQDSIDEEADNQNAENDNDSNYEQKFVSVPRKIFLSKEF